MEEGRLMDAIKENEKRKGIVQMSDFLKMIVGFLFLVFNIQVNLGSLTLDIVPDFIGYGLIFFACKGMLDWSPCFKKTRKHAIIAFVISLCRIIALNVNASFTVQGTLLGIETIAYIYLSYYVMEGLYVKNKTDKVYELNSQLRGSWIAVAVSRFVYCFLSLADLDSLTVELGLEGMESMILIIISTVAFVIEAFFLLTLNQNRVLLEEKHKVEQGSK